MKGFLPFKVEHSDPSEFLDRCIAEGPHSGMDETGVLFSYISGLYCAYHFGNFEGGQRCADAALRYLEAGTAMPYIPFFYFYFALNLLAGAERAAGDKRQVLLRKAAGVQKKMKKWARYGPENYGHKFHLIEAERQRLKGNPDKARACYEQAISTARKNGFIQEEALAWELAARFLLGQEQEDMAIIYLQKAVQGYQKWGATAKIRQLREAFPEYISRMAAEEPRGHGQIDPASKGSSGSDAAVLDLGTVIKASTAISSEIEEQRLFSKLLEIVVENTGAQQGCLILARDGKFVIVGKASTTAEDEDDYFPSQPLEGSGLLAESVVSYVSRTRETLILDQAAHHDAFAPDPYIVQNQTQSLLCFPVIHHDKFVGLFYLENNLVGGAFTRERIRLLEVLSGQMAIALENAALYKNL